MDQLAVRFDIVVENGVEAHHHITPRDMCPIDLRKLACNIEDTENNDNDEDDGYVSENAPDIKTLPFRSPPSWERT